MRGKILLTMFFLSAIAGCATLPIETVSREILVNPESPNIDLEKGERITVHFNKGMSIGSAEASSLKLIVSNITVTSIEGEIVSGAGICLSSEGVKFRCNSIQDIEGQVTRVNTEDIERIQVLQKAAGFEMTTGAKAALWTIVILIILNAAAEGCAANIGECADGFFP